MLQQAGFRQAHTPTETVKKVYTTDVVIEEQEFAESKKAAGEQAENAGYSDAGDGFMNIPDGVDGELPFM